MCGSLGVRLFSTPVQAGWNCCLYDLGIDHSFSVDNQYAECYHLMAKSVVSSNCGHQILNGMDCLRWHINYTPVPHYGHQPWKITILLVDGSKGKMIFSRPRSRLMFREAFHSHYPWNKLWQVIEDQFHQLRSCL